MLSELAAEHGMALVPPFDDAHVIAGQGTVGLELSSRSTTSARSWFLSAAAG